MYRILSDFYPSGGTPQLITNTVMVPGAGFALKPASIQADLSHPKDTENSHVELVLDPKRVTAEQPNCRSYSACHPIRRCSSTSARGGHMLAVKPSDLIEMIHNHPLAGVDSRGNSYKELQFKMVFARAGVYRVWVQFQRQGVVNTVAFNGAPVEEPAQ